MGGGGERLGEGCVPEQVEDLPGSSGGAHIAEIEKE